MVAPMAFLTFRVAVTDLPTTTTPLRGAVRSTHGANHTMCNFVRPSSLATSNSMSQFGVVVTKHRNALIRVRVPIGTF